MKTFDTICYILAAVCFLVAALSGGIRLADSPRSPWSVHLVALGLFFWVLVPLATLIND